MATTRERLSALTADLAACFQRISRGWWRGGDGAGHSFRSAVDHRFLGGCSSGIAGAVEGGGRGGTLTVMVKGDWRRTRSSHLPSRVGEFRIASVGNFPSGHGL
jgi:hypothetical protein